MGRDRVLITGGAGFIGTHTAVRLSREGYSVRVLDRLDPQIHGPNAKFSRDLLSCAECICGDVRDPDAFAAAVEGVDVVFHMVAHTGTGQSMYEVRSYVDTNVTGTAALCDAVTRSKRPPRMIVLSSSRAVYGEGLGVCPQCACEYSVQRHLTDLQAGRFSPRCPGCLEDLDPRPSRESDLLRPVSVYGWTKKMQEELLADTCHRRGITNVTLRYFNVYGSGQSLRNPYTGVLAVFYGRIMSGAPISIYERGLPVRDFVHVRDVVDAHLSALTLVQSQTLNIGSGSSSSLIQLVDALGSSLGLPTYYDLTSQFRVGDIFAGLGDLTKSRQVLGWHPRVDLKSGVAEFVQWASQQEFEDRYDQSVQELTVLGLMGGREAS